MADTACQEGWVLARGVRTHYYFAGSQGPAVVLLHGAGPGSTGVAGYRFMIPFLAAAGYRVFAPDQLSMGMTDTRPHAWPVLAHQSLVNHISDFADALCLDELAVVGNSQGAYVAAKLALDRAELVTKAFFIGSATVATAMRLEIPRTNAMDQAANYDYTLDSLRAYRLAIAHRPESVTDESLATRHALATRAGVKEARAAFAAGRKRVEQNPSLLEQFRLDATLPRLSIPARFAWGKDDKYALVELGYQLEKLLPNISFSYIDDCGHVAQMDQPEIVNAMVLELLSE